MTRIPRVIPPRSRVRLVRADRATPAWQAQIGRRFRVGYYGRKDGLDCVWLVNEDGRYEQTTDRDALLKYFEIERLTNERDYYGVHKRRLGRLRAARVKAATDAQAPVVAGRGTQRTAGTRRTKRSNRG